MKKILILIVAWTCMAFSCHKEESDTFHQTVKVTNNAECTVYVTWDWVEQYSNPEEALKYPWNQTGNKVGNWNSKDRANPGETNMTAIEFSGQSSIEGYMKVFKHMKIFFVDAAAYDRISIGDPLPDELLLDSRVYSLDDLRGIDFHIQYPL